MKLEILDVVVVAKSSYSASFNIAPGMFGGSLKASLTSILGGDATDNTAMVRHFQTETDSGVRIEYSYLKKERSNPNCGSDVDEMVEARR